MFAKIVGILKSLGILRRDRLVSEDAAELLPLFPERECINYSHLGGKTKSNKALVKELREAGLIEHHIGLIDEDGRVIGSGWCISSKGLAYTLLFNLGRY